ncbi:hypothetical protein F5880DRAFT_1544763 [Lentinula raphanica]|nr:hypothetical protein F5880DRAFT_1544763 [Lentinula raphanica]
MAPYNQPKLLKKTRLPSFSPNPFKRSPLFSKGRVPAHIKIPPATRPNHVLPAIPEAFGSPDRDRRRSRQEYAYQDLFDVQEGSDEDFDEEDRPTFTWEDEKTLVSDLLHTGNEQDSEYVKINSLADSIQAAFSVQSQDLLDDIADTLVPAVNCVKHGHQVLNNQVDDSFAVGILEFDEACKKLEAITITSHNELKKAYRVSQARNQEMLKQLEEAYARRDKLWADFEAALDEILTPAMESVKSLPSRMERTIATLEKQSKQIGKDGGSKEKYLKGLLSNFV